MWRPIVEGDVLSEGIVVRGKDLNPSTVIGVKYSYDDELVVQVSTVEIKGTEILIDTDWRSINGLEVFDRFGKLWVIDQTFV